MLCRCTLRRSYLPGTIENNLVLQRTARDEGRLRAAVRAVGRLQLFSEARVRRRAPDDPGVDSNFATLPGALTAWDVTVGARSVGDLAGLRLAAAFTEIADLRAATQLFTLDAGRDLAGDLLSLDGGVAWERVRDDGASATCDAAQPLGAGCFGRKRGDVIQLGLTLALRPSPRWFVLADYRLVVDGVDGRAAIVTHVGFGRVELRL